MTDEALTRNTLRAPFLQSEEKSLDHDRKCNRMSASAVYLRKRMTEGRAM
jgi:hypothetical protein